MGTSPDPRKRRFLAAAAATAVLLTACAEGDQRSTSSAPGDAATVQVADAVANDHGHEDVGAATDAPVELGDVFFSPTILVGAAGQRLTVHLENIGAVDHTFTIAEQEVDVALRPGGTGSAEVTFPQSGALLFVCRFHDEAGMRGGLSVDGDLAPAPGSAPENGYDEGRYGG